MPQQKEELSQEPGRLCGGTQVREWATPPTHDDEVQPRGADIFPQGSTYHHGSRPIYGRSHEKARCSASVQCHWLFAFAKGGMRRSVSTVIAVPWPTEIQWDRMGIAAGTPKSGDGCLKRTCYTPLMRHGAELMLTNGKQQNPCTLHISLYISTRELQ